MDIKLAFTELDVLNVLKAAVFSSSSGVIFGSPSALLQHPYFIVFLFHGLQGKARQKLYTRYDFSMALEVCYRMGSCFSAPMEK